MTPAEIEPATFRYIAQHLNHYATAVSPKRRQSVPADMAKHPRKLELHLLVYVE